MKLGWIAIRDSTDEEGEWEFWTQEPPSWYWKRIMICYAELGES